MGDILASIELVGCENSDAVEMVTSVAISSFRVSTRYAHFDRLSLADGLRVLQVPRQCCALSNERYQSRDSMAETVLEDFQMDSDADG